MLTLEAVRVAEAAEKALKEQRYSTHQRSHRPLNPQLERKNHRQVAKATEERVKVRAQVVPERIRVKVIRVAVKVVPQRADWLTQLRWLRSLVEFWVSISKLLRQKNLSPLRCRRRKLKNCSKCGIPLKSG